MILLSMQFMSPDWVKMEVENRWEAFAAERSFKPFETNRLDESLRVEFEEIRQARLRKWESEEFLFAQRLLERDLVRDEKCCAFAYNNVDPNYNASVVHVGERRMIVSEKLY